MLLASKRRAAIRVVRTSEPIDGSWSLLVGTNVYAEQPHNTEWLAQNAQRPRNVGGRDNWTGTKKPLPRRRKNVCALTSAHA
jgi:hypothetical protein